MVTFPVFRQHHQAALNQKSDPLHCGESSGLAHWLRALKQRSLTSPLQSAAVAGQYRHIGRSVGLVGWLVCWLLAWLAGWLFLVVLFLFDFTRGYLGSMHIETSF